MAITKSNKKSPNHKDFLVPPNAILKCTHTRSLNLSHELALGMRGRGRGGGVSSLSDPHPQRTLNLSSRFGIYQWRREEEMNPSSPRARMGREVRKKEGWKE